MLAENMISRPETEDFIMHGTANNMRMNMFVSVTLLLSPRGATHVGLDGCSRLHYRRAAISFGDPNFL